MIVGIWDGFSMLLGEMLVYRGYVTPAQLKRALARQKQRGGQLGAILVKSGAVRSGRLFAALQIQREEIVADWQHALDRLQAAQGAKHEATSRAHYELARALLEVDRTVDAAPHAKAAFDGFAATNGHDNHLTMGAARRVTEVQRIQESRRRHNQG